AFTPVTDAEAGATYGLREAELVERLLSPGDLLYLPQGTWHEERAVGESVHLWLTAPASNHLELIKEVVGPGLLAKADWRRLPTAALGVEEGEQALRLRVEE